MQIDLWLLLSIKNLSAQRLDAMVPDTSLAIIRLIEVYLVVQEPIKAKS